MKLDLQNAILVILCLVLLLGVFTLSANAASISEDVDPLSVGVGIYPSRGSTSVSSTLSVMPQVVEYDGTQILLGDGTYVGSLNNNGYYAMVSDNAMPCFACGILGYTRIISLANFNGVIGSASANAGPSYFSAPTKRSDFGYDFYMLTYPSSETFGDYLPQFNSLSSAMEEVQRMTFSDEGFLEIEEVYSGQTYDGFTSGTAFMAYTGSSNIFYAFKSNSSDVYCFSFYAEDSYRYCFVSYSSNTVKWGSHIMSSANTFDLSSSYQNTLYYTYFTNGSSYVPVSTVPVYSSLEDGLSAFMNPSPEPEPDPEYPSLEYSLPPGNIAFIQVPVGASYTLKTRMPESVLGSNHYPGNNQVLTLVNSLPTGGSAPSSPLIPWRQDGALSVLGLSRNAVYSGTNASAGYLCIVNPLYYSGTANGPYEFLSNGSIDIVIDNQTGIWVYPLDSTLGFTSGLGINVDTEIINDPFTGTVDPNTGEITWEDGSGGSSAPTTGGGNLVSTSETIFDFLRNIADEISTFLKGPIQAIQTVVSAIRQFLSSFTQLYIWLPSPVYNLITSALMIALTIGVIKIFV